MKKLSYILHIAGKIIGGFFRACSRTNRRIDGVTMIPATEKSYSSGAKRGRTRKVKND